MIFTYKIIFVTTFNPFRTATLKVAVRKGVMVILNQYIIFLTVPQDLPINWDKAPISLQNKYLNEYIEYRNPKTGAASIHEEKLNVEAVLEFIYNISRSNCQNYDPTDLVLPLDMTYGAKDYFESDARTALYDWPISSVLLCKFLDSRQQKNR